MPPWHELISLEAVLDLHERAMIEHGTTGLQVGQHSVDCIDGKIGNAWNSESYRSADDNSIPGLCFAGYLLYYIVKGHCFPDGNKRAGWATAMAVLARLGLTVKATDDEAVEFVLRIATGEVKAASEAVYWLARRLESPEEGLYV